VATKTPNKKRPASSLPGVCFLVEVAGWRNPPLHQQLKPINLLDFFPFLGQKIDTSLDTFIVARYLDAGMNLDDPT
jgi:hypothetical protein